MTANCKFIDSVINIYIANYENEQNQIKNLQEFCREHFGHFYSLLTLIKSLAIIERNRTGKTKRELEKESHQLLSV